MQLKLNNIGELKIGDELFFYNRERGVHKNYVRGFQRNEIEEADKKYFPVERFGRERVYLSFEKDGPFKDCRLVYLDHFETVVFTTQEEAEAYALKIILSFQSDELICIENTADALSQAEFYLDIRAFPQFQFKSITFPMTNPNIPDASRDQAFGIFMGLPLDIEDLPYNIAGGRYQGFVEGWTWTTRFNALDLTVIISPVAYSLQAFRWNSVPVTEAWNTLSPTLDWNNATIVA